ncbi:hypothetical protein D1007_00944 [Hordeum vulgare]|nr:hypothetical protein D1007_00944 [Hordeum vulgare]
MSARFVGSDAPGLGFYHVDAPDVNSQHQGNLKNVGIVLIEGDVSKQELADEFAEIYKTNWSWPINALDEWTFLKENVSVKVEVWKSNIETEDVLEEICIKIKKLNPKWREWSMLDQITSTLGVLVDVDWQDNFKNLYESIRVKISCKDHSRIPEERLFGIDGKIYKLLIVVEPPAATRDPVSSNNPTSGDQISTSSDPRDNIFRCCITQKL